MRLAQGSLLARVSGEPRQEADSSGNVGLRPFHAALANLPPASFQWALNGQRTSGTVYSVRSRDAMLVLALHDGSGREVEIERAELKRVVDNPHIGDRFAFS